MADVAIVTTDGTVSSGSNWAGSIWSFVTDKVKAVAGLVTRSVSAVWNSGPVTSVVSWTKGAFNWARAVAGRFGRFGLSATALATVTTRHGQRFVKSMLKALGGITMKVIGIVEWAGRNTIGHIPAVGPWFGRAWGKVKTEWMPRTFAWWTTNPFINRVRGWVSAERNPYVRTVGRIASQAATVVAITRFLPGVFKLVGYGAAALIFGLSWLRSWRRNRNASVDHVIDVVADKAEALEHEVITIGETPEFAADGRKNPIGLDGQPTPRGTRRRDIHISKAIRDVAGDVVVAAANSGVPAVVHAAEVIGGDTALAKRAWESLQYYTREIAIHTRGYFKTNAADRTELSQARHSNKARPQVREYYQALLLPKQADEAQKAYLTVVMTQWTSGLYLDMADNTLVERLQTIAVQQYTEQVGAGFMVPAEVPELAAV